MWDEGRISHTSPGDRYRPHCGLGACVRSSYSERLSVPPPRIQQSNNNDVLPSENESGVWAHDAPHPTTLTALAALRVELRRNESAQIRRRRSVESRNHRSTFASEPERCQGETIFGPTALDRVRVRRRSGTQKTVMHGKHDPWHWGRAAPHPHMAFMADPLLERR